jgi:hypothetical protein
MWRLWTLQERILSAGEDPNRLQFQLTDGILSYASYLNFTSIMPATKEAFTRLDTATQQIVFRKLGFHAWSVCSFFYAIQQRLGRMGNASPVPSSSGLEAGRMFAYISKALKFCTTSRATDEPLCLAQLLGLDFKSIVPIPSDDVEARMTQFIVYYSRELPVGLDE